MSDSNQGGTPPAGGQNPYGQGSPSGENPYGQGPPPPQNPYGEAPYPTGGQQPYGQPAPANPYAQQPAATPPYGAQPGQPPYGQSPYGQPPTGPGGGPLGDGLDMYGRPLGSDERPGTVVAAGWITIITAGLSFLLYGFITLAMLVAKDDVLREIDQALAEQNSTSTFDAEDAFGVVVAVLLVVTIWCLIACVLAVFAMRRSNVARILLVISAAVAAGFSLLGITSVVSAVPLIASVAVIILLFTGGAGDWYAHRRRY